MTTSIRCSPIRPVLAAIADDGAAGAVLTCAQQEAACRGVPLRVVHVWGEQPRALITEADRLVTEIVARCLPDAGEATIERELLHDRDPAGALAALSREAGLLVIAAGRTVDRLAGRAGCPVLVVRPAPALSGRW